MDQMAMSAVAAAPASGVEAVPAEQAALATFAVLLATLVDLSAPPQSGGLGGGTGPEVSSGDLAAKSEDQDQEVKDISLGVMTTPPPFVAVALPLFIVGDAPLLGGPTTEKDTPASRSRVMPFVETGLLGATLAPWGAQAPSMEILAAADLPPAEVARGVDGKGTPLTPTGLETKQRSVPSQATPEVQPVAVPSTSATGVVAADGSPGPAGPDATTLPKSAAPEGQDISVALPRQGEAEARLRRVNEVAKSAVGGVTADGNQGPVLVVALHKNVAPEGQTTLTDPPQQVESEERRSLTQDAPDFGQSGVAFSKTALHGTEKNGPEVGPMNVPNLATEVRSLVVAGGREARLHLEPEALGSVDVRVRYEGGQVSIGISVETESAREALQMALPHLRSTLEKEGLPVAQLDLSGGSTGWNGHQWRGEQHHSYSAPAAWESGPLIGAEAEGPSKVGPLSTTGQCVDRRV